MSVAGKNPKATVAGNGTFVHVTLLALAYVGLLSIAQGDDPPLIDVKAAIEGDEATDPRRGFRAVQALRATPVMLTEVVPSPDFFKPLVNRELSFIKRVCRPTVVQMDAIVVEAKLAFDAMSDMVDGEQRRFVRNGKPSFVGPNQENVSGNPIQRVRSDAAKYLKRKVSDEQYAIYIDESQLRDEFERDAAIDIAISMIDRRVILTEKQRQALHERLMTGWKDVDIQWIQMYQMNPSYLPEMPDGLINPVLNPNQLKLMTAARQQHVFMTVNLTDTENNPPGEVWIR
ncbi:hypothetical protein Poly51_51030 [Rubripirellula tenax]|uniref:Uncharacterized protein n=1 Tax=Rubripirellula tenax TaxID=2528015 RepID=A0A5C6EBZ5_9BACT|nr:hypothetical protein [Rubripirellula tenax]TWU47303.1 hypothetical protein Poly51_51030 [Rubripirellula tenax]